MYCCELSEQQRCRVTFNTTQMCTQTSLWTRWTSQIYSLPVNCYTVYPEADVLLFQTVSRYVESRRWKCSYYILCEKELLWKRWNRKVYGGFIVVSRTVYCFCNRLYIELKKSKWVIHKLKTDSEYKLQLHYLLCLEQSPLPLQAIVIHSCCMACYRLKYNPVTQSHSNVDIRGVVDVVFNMLFWKNS